MKRYSNNRKGQPIKVEFSCLPLNPSKTGHGYDEQEDDSHSQSYYHPQGQNWKVTHRAYTIGHLHIYIHVYKVVFE